MLALSGFVISSGQTQAGIPVRPFYHAPPRLGRIARENQRDVQTPTPDAKKTGDQVRPPAQEDAAGENPAGENPCQAAQKEVDHAEVLRPYRKNPDLVLVDTQVIALSPPRLSVAGMGDALATWFEAVTCVRAGVKNMRGGLSTQSALALARLCYRTLLADGADALQAVRTQVVTPALERIVEANTLLSGIGFESSGLAAAHAIHNGLTTAQATHAYLHGEKVAFGLLAQLVLEGQPRSVLNRVLGFASEVGLPITPADIGLTDLSKEQLHTIAVRATAEGETIHNEPFDVRPDTVADAVMAADAVGRAWKKGCSRAQEVKIL